MKKYFVNLPGLLLFFLPVTIMAQGSVQIENVYLENELTRSTVILHQIKAIVTYKSGETKEFILHQMGEKALLGEVHSITRIQIGRYTVKTYGPLGITLQLLDYYRTLTDDITEQFKAFVQDTTRPAGPDLIISVKWKMPGSSTNYDWKYSFSTGTVKYPWNWVVNNTNSEIQVKEIVDPNSLYAQEMEEEGITVGNPVKIASGQFFELFEENKRFEVHSSFGWIEPNYVDLEGQVIEGRKLNRGKNPVIAVISKKCLGILNCGLDFQIVWKTGK